MYHNLIINTSVSVALYCLVLFHHACKEELTPWRPVCMQKSASTIVFHTLCLHRPVRMLSLIYHVHIFVAIDCVTFKSAAMHGDGIAIVSLNPRIADKFLSVKAVIFFSFWQGVVFSLLVATGIVQEVGYYTADYLSYGMQACTCHCILSG
jgi:hypothetical protein